MILIVVRHLIRPELAGDFPLMIGEFTAASRAEPGTIGFEWSRSTDDPAAYFLIEAFRDAAAGASHVNSSHSRRQSPGCRTFLPRRRRLSTPTSPLTGGRGWQNSSAPPSES